MKLFIIFVFLQCVMPASQGNMPNFPETRENLNIDAKEFFPSSLAIQIPSSSSSSSRFPAWPLDLSGNSIWSSKASEGSPNDQAFISDSLTSKWSSKSAIYASSASSVPFSPLDDEKYESEEREEREEEMDFYPSSLPRGVEPLSSLVAASKSAGTKKSGGSLSPARVSLATKDEIKEEVENLVHERCIRPRWIPSMAAATGGDHDDQFFQTKVKSVLNRNPITVGRNETKVKALSRVVNSFYKLPGHVWLLKVCTCNPDWFSACSMLLNDRILHQTVSFVKFVQYKLRPAMFEFFGAGADDRAKIDDFLAHVLFGGWKKKQNQRLTLVYSQLARMVLDFELLLADYLMGPQAFHQFKIANAQRAASCNKLIFDGSSRAAKILSSVVITNRVLSNLESSLNQSMEFMSDISYSIKDIYGDLVDLRIPRGTVNDGQDDIINFELVEDYFFPPCTFATTGSTEAAARSSGSKSIASNLLLVSRVFPFYISPGNIKPKLYVSRRPVMVTDSSVYSLLPDNGAGSYRSISEMTMTIDTLRKTYGKEENTEVFEGDFESDDKDENEIAASIIIDKVEKRSRRKSLLHHRQSRKDSMKESDILRKVSSILDFIGNSRIED